MAYHLSCVDVLLWIKPCLDGPRGGGDGGYLGAGAVALRVYLVVVVHSNHGGCAVTLKFRKRVGGALCGSSVLGEWAGAGAGLCCGGG